MAKKEKANTTGGGDASASTAASTASASDILMQKQKDEYVVKPDLKAKCTLPYSVFIPRVMYVFLIE